MRALHTAIAALAVLWAGSADSQDEATQRLARGAAVYDYWCATCHASGPGMPGTQALTAKYDGSLPAVLTERSDLTPEYIGVIVRTGVSVMPPFRKTEITDTELAALSEYIVATARARGD